VLYMTGPRTEAEAITWGGEIVITFDTETMR